MYEDVGSTANLAMSGYETQISNFMESSFPRFLGLKI